ncbi:alpha/beta hydrolase [Shigella flexneri]
MTWRSRRRRYQTAPMRRPPSDCRVGRVRLSSLFPAVRPLLAFCICRRGKARSNSTNVSWLTRYKWTIYSLYERYFAPQDIAMLTLDMPSMGFFSKWQLTQDFSPLHQHA